MIQSLTADQFNTVREGYDPIANRSSTINKVCYVDPQFFDVEKQEIFKKSWQFVCHEEKLKEPGNYVTADVQGQSILITRTNEGELKAFYNVCQHRAHGLLKGEGKTRLITCPYHAWVYKLDGTLFEARRSELIENFDKSKICLTGVKLEVFCHLVFVNLDPEAAPLNEQTSDLEKEINEYAPDLGNLTFARRLTYTINSNWKSVVDNFLECYHCPTAHRDFCTLIDMDTYKVTTHGIWSSHMAKARVSGNDAYNIEGANVTDHAVWFLWPNMTLMRYPGRGNFMVWRFYPVSETETYEVFDFFFETASPTKTEQEAIQFIDSVLQPEDIALVESVQKGMGTPAYEQGRYLVDPEGSGMSEHAVHHFHGLVIDAYAGAVRK